MEGGIDGLMAGIGVRMAIGAIGYATHPATCGHSGYSAQIDRSVAACCPMRLTDDRSLGGKALTLVGSGARQLKPAMGWIGAEKQITERPAQQVGDPPLRQMVRTIMDYVAALAQALEIT